MTGKIEDAEYSFKSNSATECLVFTKTVLTLSLLICEMGTIIDLLHKTV